MTELNLDEAKIKQLLKTALLEVIQEQKEVLSDLLAEIIEDIALEKAIKEGEDTETASREDIFKILVNKGLPPDVDKVKQPLKLNVGEWKNWSPESTFRREDIYDTDCYN